VTSPYLSNTCSKSTAHFLCRCPAIISAGRPSSSYEANALSPLFAELRSIVLKTVGTGGTYPGCAAPLSSAMRAALVYGSVARRMVT
jgi:hypothetical protein